MREQQAQQELKFWSTYSSNLCEMDKQLVYAEKMGLRLERYAYDLKGKSVLEVGAGPNALVLKAVNGRRKIIEPLSYPNWVWERYDYFGVEYDRCSAEEMYEYDWDEVWIANVLQHTDTLDLALRNIRGSAKLLRIFEFLDVPTDELHNFTLQKEHLDRILGIDGSAERIDRPYMYQAYAYFGVYKLQTERESLLNRHWGGDLHRAMIHYIKDKSGNKPLVGAEVGVLAGQSTEITLKTLNIEKLYLIDPYMVYDTDTYTQAQLSAAKQAAVERLAPFQDRIQWLHLKSTDAIKYLTHAGQFLDFAYLDGAHDYRSVIQDVTGFYPLVKNDGFLGGHDYIDDIVEPEKHRFIQVKSAVRDFTAQHNIPYYSCDFAYSDWWIDKSEIQRNVT